VTGLGMETFSAASFFILLEQMRRWKQPDELRALPVLRAYADERLRLPEVSYCKYYSLLPLFFV